MAEIKKTFNFAEDQLSQLKFLDMLIPRLEGWLAGLKNEFSMRVGGEMERCGFKPEDLTKEGKKIAVNLDSGSFDIITPEKKKEEPKLEVAK